MVSTGPSKGAKAGIGVGAAFGAIIAMLLVVVIFSLRKRKQAPKTEEQGGTAAFHGQGPAPHEVRYELGHGETKTVGGNTAAELSPDYHHPPHPRAELDGRPRH
jgi:hypothetical protein